MQSTLRSLATLAIAWCSLSLALHAQRPAITGISHVVFYADDIQKSSNFYANVLAWPSFPGPGQVPRFYANPNQYVELLPPPVRNQDHRLNRVAFATPNAEALRLYLGKNGIAVPKTLSHEPDGSQSFTVPDPEGNPVEFTQSSSHKLPSPTQAQLSRRLSTHIMHAGYVVHNRAALDHFYKDLLGFHLYWQGGAKSGDVDWVMMQVPDGTDWIEYMLYLPQQPTREALASADHIAPGVESVADLQQRLARSGWTFPQGKDPKVLGVDGKLQLDLNDPDGTRIEFMEFHTVKTPCCSPFTGRQPGPTPSW